MKKAALSAALGTGFVLTAAMALRQMGFANEIVNLAFGLLLGAVAVAVAIAFGVGGRDVAARQLESWRNTIGQGAGGQGGMTHPGRAHKE